MDWLAHRGRTHHDTTALIDVATGEQWSYPDLSAEVDRFASGLAARGVDARARVGTFLPRSPAHVQVIWAVRRLGATVVPMDPTEPPTRRRELVEHADVDLVVADQGAESTHPAEDGVHTTTPAEVRKPTTRETQPTAEAIAGATEPGQHHLDETMVVLFTSGTTGDPKGVGLTARNIGASAAGSAFRLGVEPADRWLLTLPLYHMGGLSIPFRAAIYGTTVVLEREFDATKTHTTITDQEVTGVSLVPTMLSRLLDGGELPDTLRFALVGGAPTPPELVERALKVGVPLAVTYGMTETASQVATALPADLRENPETVGRPIRTATVEIVDEVGTELPTGHSGEIVVSGPIVSPGYLEEGDRENSHRFETGDVGHLDPAGRLFVTGRKSDQIITGGENVHPSEVAAALRGLPGIDDAAVVGVPDPEWGERVVAVVVQSGGWSATSLRERLREEVADHKIPKALLFVEELPRTRSGTVDRAAARELFTRDG